MGHTGELVAAIRDAFPHSPVPTRNDIWPKSRGRHLEADQVADFFAGKKWTEISLLSLQNEYIGDGSACLCFMNPKAFRYYFPAYMLIAIQDYDNADVIADSAVNALIPTPDLRSWWEERTSGLNAAQRSVITTFLHFMQEQHAEDYPCHGPKEALTSWR